MPTLRSWSYCLTKSSAEVVEVIHTNGVWGNPESVGHIDFYINDGMNQPGCHANPMSPCHHQRAPNVFAEALNNPISYIGRLCIGDFGPSIFWPFYEIVR